MRDKIIYADNASTTPVSKGVIEVMTPFFCEYYGNPSSLYSFANSAERAILKAREKTAALIGCETNEIYFTSGGTEADNWAVRGMAEKASEKGKRHIVTTNYEHPAVLNTCKALEKKGFEVTYLQVDKDGLITAGQVKKALRDDTGLVTVMYANNEIGSVLPIAEIGAVCRERGVTFHTDAVQAVGNIEINVKEQNIDMLSLSGHKIHAPKGVGALYIKKGTVIPNLFFGGGQERGKRSGTENVPGIAGLGQAAEEALSGFSERVQRTLEMRDRLIENILKIPGSRLNGGAQSRLPGNINVSFLGVEGEALVLTLSAMGICASSGSACSAASLEPSHVLTAIGLPHEIAHGSLRLTINGENADEEIDYIIKTVPQAVEKIRNMSPLWEDITKGKGNARELLKYVSAI